MKTATEVGGDYYDFHIGLDGTLTVVIGDATGHGMKAGTMVTTTKSLFNVFASNKYSFNFSRNIKMFKVNAIGKFIYVLNHVKNNRK